MTKWRIEIELQSAELMEDTLLHKRSNLQDRLADIEKSLAHVQRVRARLIKERERLPKE